MEIRRWGSDHRAGNQLLHPGPDQRVALLLLAFSLLLLSLRFPGASAPCCVKDCVGKGLLSLLYLLILQIPAQHLLQEAL